MSAHPLLKGLAIDLAEVVLPQRCVVCRRFGAALHAPCLEALPLASPLRCPRCWTPGSASFCPRCLDAPPPYEALRARFRFEGDVRRALLEAKFRGKTALLAPLASAAAEVVPPDWRIDAVVPIPLHRGRQRRRGYNQATLIARTVAGRLGRPLVADVLRRARATAPQAALTAEARARNLAGAFEARPLNSEVLLIDDITTTGATFEEAAAALLNAGAIRVYALAIARED